VIIFYYQPTFRPPVTVGFFRAYSSVCLILNLVANAAKQHESQKEQHSHYSHRRVVRIVGMVGLTLDETRCVSGCLCMILECFFCYEWRCCGWEYVHCFTGALW